MIKCKDGEILDFITERNCHQGCDTCDYGWEYIDFCEIKFTNLILKCWTNYNGGYLLSLDFWVKLLCSNAQAFADMTQCEIIEFIQKKVKKECKTYEENITFEIIDQKSGEFHEGL